MDANSREPEQIRQVVRAVLKDHVRLTATVLISLVLSVFGLLITAASFNRSSVLLLVVGVLFGAGLIAFGARNVFLVARKLAS